MTEPADDSERDDEAAGAVDDGEHADELPEDLDAHGYVGPYVFPDNNRRKIPAILYLLIGAGAILLYTLAGSDAVLVNRGFLLGGVALILFGVYSFQAGFDLNVDETDALVAASRTVGFPVGHASAQLGWRGLRSRPTWRILLYSSEDPPERRGLVLVDGVEGQVLEHFVEDNPEDWSDLGDGEDTGGSASDAA